MISFKINNKRTMKIEQRLQDDTVTVTIEDVKGNIESLEHVTGQDVVSLMNYYSFQKNNGNELI